MIKDIKITRDLSDPYNKRYILSASVGDSYNQIKLSINESSEVFKMTSSELEEFASTLFGKPSYYESPSLNESSTNDDLEDEDDVTDEDIDTFINNLNSSSYADLFVEDEDDEEDHDEDDIEIDLDEEKLEELKQEFQELKETVDDFEIEYLCESILEKFHEMSKYAKLNKKDAYDNALTEAESIADVIAEETKDLKVWNVTISKNRRQMIIKIRATSEQEAIAKMRRQYKTATLVNVRLDPKMKKTDKERE